MFFAAMSLIQEKAEANLMLKKPRSITNDRLVNYKLLLQAYGFIGMMEATAAFGMYFFYIGYYGGIPPQDLFLLYNGWTSGFHGKSDTELCNILYHAQTIYFVTLVITQFGNLHATRTRYLSWFQHNPFKKESRNLYLFLAMFCSLSLALLIVYIPFFNSLFNTRPIAAQFWFIPIAFAIIVFTADELRKLFCRKFDGWFTKYIAW